MESVAPVAAQEVTVGPHRLSVAEMLGETFREAGILLAVFIPLDLFVQGHPLTTWSIVAIVVLPSTLLAMGIGLERRRRQ